MFSSSEVAESETEVSKWLNDSLLCDLSNEQIEIGCGGHEVRADRAAPKRRSRIAKGYLDATALDLGEIVAHRINLRIRHGHVCIWAEECTHSFF